MHLLILKPKHPRNVAAYADDAPINPQLAAEAKLRRSVLCFSCVEQIAADYKPPIRGASITFVYPDVPRTSGVAATSVYRRRYWRGCR